ncbi:hypothetical protein D3C85_1313870 [compost metagenome]
MAIQFGCYFASEFLVTDPIAHSEAFIDDLHHADHSRAQRSLCICRPWHTISTKFASTIGHEIHHPIGWYNLFRPQAAEVCKHAFNPAYVRSMGLIQKRFCCRGSCLCQSSKNLLVGRNSSSFSSLYSYFFIFQCSLCHQKHVLSGLIYGPHTSGHTA